MKFHELLDGDKFTTLPTAKTTYKVLNGLTGLCINIATRKTRVFTHNTAVYGK